MKDLLLNLDFKNQNWFSQHIDYLFFIYGLSFLTMGIAILIMPKKESHFHLGKILWMLAIYAFLHSVGDFISIISDIKEETKNDVGLLFTSVSYLFLFEFGRRLMNLSKKTIPWWLLTVCIALTLSFSLFVSDFFTSVSIFTGYFIRFPAGIMASIGFISYYSFIKSDINNKKTKTYFLIASIAMFFWAIFCGIVRIEGKFFPANVINTTTFFEFTGLPVQVFRTIVSILTTVALLGILDIFKWETVYKLIENRIELEKHRYTLEQQVAQRTEELHHINIELENDIKIRIKTEEALAEASNNWQSTFDAITDLVILLSPEQEILEINKAGENTLGLKRKDIIGKKCYRLIHNQDFPIKECPCCKAGISKSKEVTEYSQYGKEYELTAWPIFDINKKINGFTHIVKDITKRKQTEEALLKSEHNFNNFIHDSLLAIYFCNADTKKIVYANPAFFQLTGYSQEELDSLTIYDFINNPKEETDALFNQTIQSKQRSIGERQWKTKDGRLINMFVNASYISSNNEGIIYISAQNITKLKQTETEKEKLITELSDKYNELMQFNYIVSHNLRAPVANLLGLSNLITMPGHSEEDKLKIIEHIQQSANKMDDMIKDLNVILSSRSTINIKKEKVFIHTLNQSITSTLEKQIKETNCYIKTTISEDASELFTVKSYLESILYNLISNAIKYHSVERRPQIIISTKKVNNDFLISVSDNGIGIDMEKQGQYIFGLYKRFNLDVEGKGLGLHMTKTQVETLGGKISIESEVGKGTTFNITLPIKQ